MHFYYIQAPKGSSGQSYIPKLQPSPKVPPKPVAYPVINQTACASPPCDGSNQDLTGIPMHIVYKSAGAGGIVVVLGIVICCICKG